jgi:hypothetical protein
MAACNGGDDPATPRTEVRGAVEVSGDVTTTTTAPTTTTTAPDPQALSSYLLDASKPPLSPGGRLDVGPFVYGGDVGRVLQLLGPPTVTDVEDGPLGSSRIYRWQPDVGFTFKVGTPIDSENIDEFRVEAQPMTETRLTLWGGLVMGSSTMGDVVGVWGDEYSTEFDPVYLDARRTVVGGYDYRFRFSACDGPWPVVVQFGYREYVPEGPTDPGGFNPKLLSRVFTHLWIVWADEAPYTSGCS